jgi:NADH-quinone oxidoreductase subunit E
MSIDLVLGPRPDEPGPPIAGPKAYPADIEARLITDAHAIIGKYPQARSALLPLLHLVQAEDGYLTAAGIGFCADQLGLAAAEVTAVATFYSMYRRTPTGRYLVGVCTNTLCAIMGGDAILDSLEEHLGIHPGQTTADGSVTLEHLECNAACDYAPVIMVNWEFFDNQTITTARELVDELQADRPVTASRGGTVCPFTQTARVLAGLPGPTEPAGPQDAGTATLAGLRVAQALDMSAPPVPTAPTGSGSTTDGTEAAAVESTKEEPAPGPSATVPAKPATTETDPSTTDSGGPHA